MGPNPPYHLVGNRYGMLVVEAVVREHDTRRWTYYGLCKCDCGETKRILLHNLKRGATKSCGCDKSRYDKIRGSKSTQFTGYEGITGTFWKGYRQGASRRGLDFDVSIEYAWGLFVAQEGKCALSGVELVFGANTPHTATTASIDRIDNSKGYVEGNLQWVHKNINLMRNVLPVDEFIHWCTLVANQNGERNGKSELHCGRRH